MEKPWTNLEKQEDVQSIKAASNDLRGYTPGDWKGMPDPYGPALMPAPSGSVGIDPALLSELEGEAAKRGGVRTRSGRARGRSGWPG